MKGHVKISPVAKQIPFDNSTNGFSSNNTQGAIEEAKTLSSIYNTEVKASDLITITSSTYSLMSGMTITPPSGKYLVMLSVSAGTTGVNGSGDIALYKAGSEITGTQRRLACEAAILGLITISTNLISSGLYTHSIVSVNGSQAIEGRFRENGTTTFQVTNRIMTIVRIGESD